jgi:hypothetical protein
VSLQFLIGLKSGFIAMASRTTKVRFRILTSSARAVPIRKRPSPANAGVFAKLRTISFGRLSNMG